MYTPYITHPGDHFGKCVSISGDGQIVAIGAPNNNEYGTASGEVRVFQNINGAWSQLGQDINGLNIENENALLKIGNDFTIGESGIATLEMSNGNAEIKGNFRAGVNKGSEGTIKISGKANLIVEKDFMVGGTGSATVDHTGGTIKVGGTLILENTENETSNFNMINGTLDANEIILTKKEDFKFNGGTIKTKKITEYKTNDFKLLNYDPHPTITASMNV